MSKKSYTVTETAGAWVAGVRNPGANKTLPLTEEQARYDVVAGHLVLTPPDPEATPVVAAEPERPARGRKAE